MLVFNDTKVIPARLEGRRGEPGSGRRCSSATACGGGGRRASLALREGRPIAFGAGRLGDRAEAQPRAADAARLRRRRAGRDPARGSRWGCRCRPTSPARAADEAERGTTTRPCSRERTARWPRRPRRCISTPACSRRCAAGIGRETLTLHVGAGTFLPVKVEDIAEHRMHAEWGEHRRRRPPRRSRGRAAGGRLIPVGTTSLRVLETAAGGAAGAPSRATRDLHPARLPVPRGGRADDQLPPAEVDTDHAGHGADGARGVRAIYAHAIAPATGSTPTAMRACCCRARPSVCFRPISGIRESGPSQLRGEFRVAYAYRSSSLSGRSA